jgi:hypothetical protein
MNQIISHRNISSVNSFAEFAAWFRQKDITKSALAAAVGTNRVSIRLWLTGRTFPRDEYCTKLFEITHLDCFSPANRAEMRAEHERLIPPEIKQKRRAKYQTNADVFRKRSLSSWRKRRERQRQFVLGAELAELRKDPRKRKNVCRECGQILRDIGPHLCPRHGMKVAQYKENWGFLRSRNATRSEETTRKQKDAMKHHHPPKWTRKLLPKAAKASKLTNQPGSARLEERLNARDRGRGGKKFRARPKQQKRGDIVTDARIVRLHLRGKGLKEIAVSTGRSSTAISLRLKRIGYDGRNHAYFHGDEVGPRHFRDYCADFKLIVPQAAADVAIGIDWAYARMNSKHRDNPFTSDLGSRLIRAREKRTAIFRLKPATAKGGRPKMLPPSEISSLQGKYPILLKELQELRARPSGVGLWAWLCDEFRVNRMPLMKRWPAFFDWAEKNLVGTWKPNDLARQFLSADYDVSSPRRVGR